ncbi:sensor domain-containing diguanylate cyclase [Methylophaga sp.]|uniref:sensor domain-containing diguanylate cyclase n=1 Tax=Methylophaga sp. TaxID=2024840 RepID=UPI003F69BC3C
MTKTINAPHPQVREGLITQWQGMLEILAEFMGVPAALLMNFHMDELTVYAKNNSTLNPFIVGDKEKCSNSGLYCERVIKTNKRLFVHNALETEEWKDNPDVKFNLINYLGYPINWPNGDVFGTLCVLDSEAHYYTDKQERLMVQFRDMFQTHLELLEKNLTLENLSKNLEHLANTDELTGIWNRRAFIAESEKELQRAFRNERPICLLMMDIDDFKLINDEFGHDVGDQALKHFSHGIMAIKRSYDIFGRIGGEEFAVLLPETKQVEAVRLAKRICEKVSNLFFHTQQKNVQITVSIGVYQLTSHDSIFSALSKADKLLYNAKRAGKNQVQAM